jgi:hypothetical protein
MVVEKYVNDSPGRCIIGRFIVIWFNDPPACDSSPATGRLLKINGGKSRRNETKELKFRNVRPPAKKVHDRPAISLVVIVTGHQMIPLYSIKKHHFACTTNLNQ